MTVNGETFHQGGMYVAWEAPEAEPPPYPIVLVHGEAVPGTQWFDTPGGRATWAERLRASENPRCATSFQIG